jgi:hypothetical protein
MNMQSTNKTFFLSFLLLLLLGCQETELPEPDQGDNPDPGDTNERPGAPELPDEPETETPTPSDPPDVGETPTPPPSPPINILKIGILGDLNGSLGDPNYASTVKAGMGHILNHQFDLILGTGDFTSGEDYRHRFSSSRFDKMWKSFEEKILNPILKSGTPFAPTPGNHDASIERERGHYKKFWKSRVPKLEMVSTQMFPYYYSFLYKGVFFISLDDVRTGTLRDRSYLGVTQREWIAKQLNSAEAKNSIAQIAFGHVPIYPVLSKSKHAKKGRGKYYEFLSKEQQGKRDQSLEKIFKDGGIDLAIFGHSHAYYPGVIQHQGESIKDSLKVLSMPCLGHGNRYLDQRTRARSARGYGFVKVDLTTGNVEFDAYTSKGVLVDKGRLPSKIRPYSHITIHRDDLAKNLK